MPRITPDVNPGDVSRRGFLRLSALASAGLASGAAVRPALAQTAPKKGGTLRVGFYLEASTMDPHLSGSKVDRQIYHNIYEPLLVLDTSLGIKPGLAESWQQPDSRTLVMKLRHGVKFHDGTDFNAEAAKFNFNRMKTEPKSVRKGEVASIESGDIDVIDYVQPRDVAAVKADKNVVVLDVPSLASFAYQLNHTRPPFDNKALRQAVAYAIDLEQIVKGVWLNVGVPSNGPIPPTSWAYDNTLKPIKRDLARAKAKLAEGGKPGGFAFTMTTANIPINIQEAEVIQAQLTEAGMSMKVKLVDAATQLSDGNSRNFDMISYQWSGRPDPDGNIYQFYRTTPGTSLNWSGISNPQLDALLDKTREVSAQAERKKLYSQVTKILQEELPMIFIVHPVEPKAFGPRVQGYEPIPDGMMRFRTVWLK